MDGGFRGSRSMWFLLSSVLSAVSRSCILIFRAEVLNLWHLLGRIRRKFSKLVLLELAPSVGES